MVVVSAGAGRQVETQEDEEEGGEEGEVADNEAGVMTVGRAFAGLRTAFWADTPVPNDFLCDDLNKLRGAPNAEPMAERRL